MEWNNGKERALFEKEQAKLRKEYLAAGMTEEQIQVLRDCDEEWYRSRRREARHTQRMNITVFDEDDREDESQNPLLKKFVHSFSVEDKHFENKRFGWIEEIEDKALYQAVSFLTDADKEILTMLLYDGMKQKDIAEQRGVKKSAISRKIGRLKNFLKDFLKHVNF
jgi:RNA polymerase sigma factor (sigma-70 family)